MDWHADFYLQQPYFASIAKPADVFKGFHESWPEINDFNRSLAAQDLSLRCINGDQPTTLAYEHHINQFAAFTKQSSLSSLSSHSS